LYKNYKYISVTVYTRFLDLHSLRTNVNAQTTLPCVWPRSRQPATRTAVSTGSRLSVCPPAVFPVLSCPRLAIASRQLKSRSADNPPFHYSGRRRTRSVKQVTHHAVHDKSTVNMQWYDIGEYGIIAWNIGKRITKKTYCRPRYL